MQNISFIISAGLVLLAGLLQSVPAVSFYGVRPDILIPLLVVLMFTARSFKQYLVFVLLAAISMRYSNPVSKEVIIFTVIMLTAHLLKKYLSGQLFFVSILMTAAITLIFYLAIDYSFVFGNSAAFLTEVFWNVALSVMFWLIFEDLLTNK